MKNKASKEQVAEWKKKYGEVFEVVGDDSVCYLRKPDRRILSAVSSIANDAIKSAEFILNNCWLGGDEDIKTNDEKFFAVSSKMGELLKIKTAELNRL